MVHYKSISKPITWDLVMLQPPLIPAAARRYLLLALSELWQVPGQNG